MDQHAEPCNTTDKNKLKSEDVSISAISASITTSSFHEISKATSTTAIDSLNSKVSTNVENKKSKSRQRRSGTVATGLLESINSKSRSPHEADKMIKDDLPFIKMNSTRKRGDKYHETTNETLEENNCPKEVSSISILSAPNSPKTLHGNEFTYENVSDQERSPQFNGSSRKRITGSTGDARRIIEKQLVYEVVHPGIDLRVYYSFNPNEPPAPLFDSVEYFRLPKHFMYDQSHIDLQLIHRVEPDDPDNPIKNIINKIPQILRNNRDLRHSGFIQFDQPDSKKQQFISPSLSPQNDPSSTERFNTISFPLSPGSPELPSCTPKPENKPQPRDWRKTISIDKLTIKIPTPSSPSQTTSSLLLDPESSPIKTELTPGATMKRKHVNHRRSLSNQGEAPILNKNHEARLSHQKSVNLKAHRSINEKVTISMLSEDTENEKLQEFSLEQKNSLKNTNTESITNETETAINKKSSIQEEVTNSHKSILQFHEISFKTPKELTSLSQDQRGILESIFTFYFHFLFISYHLFI